MFHTFALLALTAAPAAGISAGYVPGPNPKAYRLSGDAVPSAYRLTFNVVPAQGVYSASEEIDVRLAKPAAEVVLHAVDLDIMDARIQTAAGMLPARVVPHPESETVSLAVPQTLPAGPAMLAIAFRAKLRDDLRGFYLVKSKDGTPYAFTQFEPTDARRAFPCFDEPAFKATYQVTVLSPRGTEAIANAPETDEHWDMKAQAWVYHFAKTPPISSYLVALGVGRFSFVGPSVTKTAAHTPIRVITLPGEERLAGFALSFASELLPWYESYFGLPYPYAKLDLVAVPDFEAGAMENAGAIFFRDRDLLLDAANGSVDNQKLVAIVVAHEMAHQWFGDLVTMKWWDDLWLNEAFASLMENESVSSLRPDWHIWDVFRADGERPLYDDALASTHPIHFEVATAEEANEAFDDITYLKGQACLRMLELFLSPKVWQTGLHDYLAAHAGGNAAEADLWAALAKASQQPVADIAKSWFEQPGYPLVTAKRSGRSLTLTQQRFWLNPKEATKDHALWQIPVCVKEGGKELGGKCQLMTGRTTKIALDGRPQWLDANSDASGFYRVRYAASELKALDAPMRQPASEESLTAPEKIALLGDARALARAGVDKLAPELQILADLGADRNATLAGSADHDLQALQDYLLEEKDRPAFAAYVSSIFGPAMAELKWDPQPKEDPDRRQLRARVIHALGTLARDPAVVAEASKRVAAWEQNPKALDPTLVSAALEITAQHGDARLWDDYRARMDAAATPEDHDHFMVALTEFRAPALVQKSLALAVSGDIRKQDEARYLGALQENPDAAAATWAFVKANWAPVLAHTTAQSLAWAYFTSVGYLCTPDARADAAAFFAAHKIEGSDRPSREALESIDLCVRFKALHQGELGKWLEGHAAKPTASR
ncbi:MAG TPA: M1 family metallopeptidase [Myxococcales bacterium]|nr:M1 family metallopeptidase [Myxococcales bacterium]